MHTRELFEMAYSRKKAEQIITGLERPLNEYLIKLIAFDFSDDEKSHFRHEVDIWLDEIRSIRLKPANRTAPASFYYRILFDEPFGGSEVPNMTGRLRLLSRRHKMEPTMASEEAAQWLQVFHRTLSQQLHDEEDVFELIP